MAGSYTAAQEALTVHIKQASLTKARGQYGVAQPGVRE